MKGGYSIMDDALGMVESRGLATAVTVADIMVKTANVELLGVERARGQGWVTVKVKGDVGAVKAAVQAGIAVAETCGDYIASKVIPRPVDAVKEFFMQPGQKEDWAGDYENATLAGTGSGAGKGSEPEMKADPKADAKAKAATAQAKTEKKPNAAAVKAETKEAEKTELPADTTSEAKPAAKKSETKVKTSKK